MHIPATQGIGAGGITELQTKVQPEGG